MTRAETLRDMKAIFDDHEKQAREELGEDTPAARAVLMRLSVLRRDVVSAVATSRLRRIRGQVYREQK